MMVGHDISSYAQTLPRPLSLPRSLLSSSSSSSSPSHLLSRLASFTSSCPSSPSDSSFSRLSSFQGLMRSHSDPMSSSPTSEPSSSSSTSPITTSALPPSSTSTASAVLSTAGSSASTSTDIRNSSGRGGTGSGAPSSHRLSLPRPQPTTMSAGRMPVRLGLSDPRVQSYISKPLTSPRQEQPLPTSSSSSFGGAYSQSRPPTSSSSSAAARRAYGPSETSSHYSAPMVDSRDPQTSHPLYSSSSSRSHDQGQSQHGHTRHSSLDARDDRTRRDHRDYWSLSSHASQRDPEGERQQLNPSGSTYVSAQGNESMHRMDHGHVHRKYSDSQIYAKTTGHSSSPSPLPSPSPSLTSMSPDWHSVARPQHDSYQQQHPHQQYRHQQPQYNTLPQSLQQNGHSQQQQQQQHARPNLSSPVNSEVDAGSMDLRVLPPLFTSSPPPAFSSSHHGPRLLPPPSGMMKEQPDALYAAALFSGSRGASSSSMAPTDPRAVSPPLTSLNWSSKHHHHRVPVRSPMRGTDQDIMATSLTESESSGYMKMDFYDIYLRNPKLLRPEGGKLDERRALEDAAFARAHALAGHGPYMSASTEGSSKSKSIKGRPTLTTKRSRSPTTALSRRQSISLMSTATGRVLRHEDAKQDDVVVHRLGVQPLQQRRGSKSISNSMSIRNLLSDDTVPVVKGEHHDYRNNSGPFRSSHSISSLDSEGSDYSRMTTMGSSGTLVKKRKKTTTQTGEEGEEPKKRKRISKKQLAEAGLLGEDGEVKKRKRTKKITDPDHVSPAGFRHGGERVVQEPEELVILEPDVGPISMLDVKSPPRVIWKGTPLSVVGKPGYDQLHPHEEYIASTLRLSPAQYLACKRTLIMASREYLATPDGKQFRKSDAQKLCRIDVNKTSRLWEAFAKIGWLAGITEQDI